MPAGTPQSVALTASAAAVGSVTFATIVKLVTVYNRTGTNEVFVTVDGSTPTVGGNNQFYVPGFIGASAQIPIASLNPVETPTGVFPTLRAISTGALSLYLVVNE